MKRNSYVDNKGNPIDHSFESKKTILNIFFVVGTVIPVILIGFIIYTAAQNSKCNKIYNAIKSANIEYLKDEDKFPNVEGENVTVSVGKLYNEKYLNAFNTNNMTCSGTIKTTKYKKDYIYTLHLTSCNVCTTDKRYNGWSNEIDYYPTSKQIVDVVPYYNYYERQVVVTDWSRFYEKKELDKTKSKYGINLPKKSLMDTMPAVPEEGNVVEVQREEALNYRYKDKTWLWYDIVGDYSDFSSEKPQGYENKDEDAEMTSKWSKWSLTHPGEKSYREIDEANGYQFYYEKDGKKVYANNKNYLTEDEVDEGKYDQREDKTVPMYRYRDTKWRWYNGQKRDYSNYSSTKPDDYNYRDDETETETDYSSWSADSAVDASNSGYRIEEQKTLSRFRYVYEILSDPVLKNPVQKQDFVKEVGTTVPEFITLDQYKIDVSYKFKYRKR